MNYKNILLVIAIIIVVAGAFLFLMSHQATHKEDSKIAITSAANLTEGDNVSFQLTDINGTPISGQNVNVSIFNSTGGVSQQILTTDANGRVSFETNSTTTGNCVIKIKFGGNDIFNGCNLTQNIVINKKVIQIVNNTNITTFNYSAQNTHTESSQNYHSGGYNDENVVTVQDY